MIKSSQARACLGYERLALGKITDAIKLLYCENPSDDEIEKLDLTNIAEIKSLRTVQWKLSFLTGLKHLKKWVISIRRAVKSKAHFSMQSRMVQKALEKADDYGED